MSETIIVALIGAATTVGGSLIAFLSARKGKKDAVKNGLQCLLRAEIIRSYDKYDDKGYCPVYAKEALTKAYSAYHKLGGNDVATGLFQKMMAMPNDIDPP